MPVIELLFIFKLMLSKIFLLLAEYEKFIFQEGILDLRNNLTKKSKKWVVKRLSKIWGRIAKQGVPLIKEFLTEVRKEIIKHVVKHLLTD